MSTETPSGRLRPTLRVLVTLVLFVFCSGMKIFVLPTHRVMIASAGRGLEGWIAGALGVMPWVVVAGVGAAIAVTALASEEARSSTAATALAVVDVALVMWVASIGLAFMDVAIKIPQMR